MLKFEGGRGGQSMTTAAQQHEGVGTILSRDDKALQMAHDIVVVCVENFVNFVNMQSKHSLKSRCRGVRVPYALYIHHSHGAFNQT